jgi:WD40 repeat protein/serine/threonine protein kinase
MSDPSSARDPVEELAEEFAARYRRGELPTLSEYTDKYPHLADQIREVFPALVVMEHFGSVAGLPTGSFEPRAGDSSAVPEQLGDYRILREVGRGGMGVVYEAVQESLGRHVALKILPFHRLMGPTHLERFKREARAAAQLHHTNIVPVFGVGEAEGAEGVHYYAMQFIQGQGLDTVLEEVRRLRRPTIEKAREPGRALSRSIAESLLTGQFKDVPAEEGAAISIVQAESAVPPPTPGSRQNAARGRALAGGTDTPSELASQPGWQYCRSVAQVGVQVAEALAYAHRQRVLHRDIKPANLLLDTRGTVWITDFGLAKTEGSDDLTHPGDIVGTVRFMAPERFQGKADPRSDVYSLGITLYEMLTLQPAFADSNRARLVERVVQEEPKRLRELDPHIPRDLETIVLKAGAKEPDCRYASAEALAEDLRRFLNNEPIQARPVGQLERLWRWARRNPVIAAMSAAMLLLLMLVAGTGTVGYVQTTLALGREAIQRKVAEEAEANTRRLYYAANMRRVREAWESHNILGLQELLAETKDFPQRGFEWYYWQRLCRIEHLALVGHTGGVTALAFSPDGQQLVTGVTDGTARVWDATSGREILCLHGHRNEVRAVAFAPDGKWLVTGSDDETARMWDVASGRELRVLQSQNSGPVWAVAVTPDGKRVITGSQDATARIRDAASGQGLLILPGQTTLPTVGATIIGLLNTVQAHGPFLAASAIYPGRSGHTGPISAVAVTEDGKWVVTGSGDGTAKIWDTAKGCQLQSLDHHFGISVVAVTGDGKWVVTGSGDGTAKIWDTASGRAVRTVPWGHGDLLSLALSPDGRRLMTGYWAGTANIRDLASGREILTLLGHGRWISGVAFSPDGKRLATGSLEGTARVWDITPGRGTSTVPGHTGLVWAVAVAPDGQRLVIANGDGTAKLWDAVTGRELQTIPGHHDNVWSVAFTPDGQRIVTGCEDGTARVLDAISGHELQKLTGHSAWVGPVAITPDGQRIITGSGDGTAKVWDATSGRVLQTLKGHIGPVWCVAVASDGQRLITGGQEGTARIWDLASGRLLVILEGHTYRVWSVAVTPDGQRIITGSDDGTARVWDAVSGRELMSLRGHIEPGLCVAVTPDGQRLITGSGDGTASVWDVVSGRELLTLKGHTGPVRCVAVTADGQRIITSSDDGTVKIWKSATPEQIALWERQEQEAARRQANWQRPLTGAPGFIHDWLVLAPLHLRDDAAGAKGLECEQLSREGRLRPRAGEQVQVVDQIMAWRAHHDNEPVLDFNRFVGKLSPNSVAYAVCYVMSEAERHDLLLQVGSDDQAKVYLNEQEIYKCIRWRSLVALDPIGPVSLRKGTNVLVFKVVNGSWDWLGCLRFIDAEGNPAKGLRFSSTAE